VKKKTKMKKGMSIVIPKLDVFKKLDLKKEYRQQNTKVFNSIDTFFKSLSDRETKKVDTESVDDAPVKILKMGTFVEPFPISFSVMRKNVDLSRDF
jgi:hypothetical protein